MEPPTGPYRCDQCSRTWLISDYHVPARDPDSLNCSCGKEIGSWRGSRQYRAERIYPSVLTLDKDLTAKNGTTIGSGSQVETTRDVGLDREGWTAYRVVRAGGSEYQVSESALDVAWLPRPFKFLGLSKG